MSAKKFIKTLAVLVLASLVVLAALGHQKAALRMKNSDHAEYLSKRAVADSLTDIAQGHIRDGALDSAESYLRDAVREVYDAKLVAHVLLAELHVVRSDQTYRHYLVQMTDQEYETLKHKARPVDYVSDPALNSLFNQRLKEHLPRRAQYIHEKDTAAENAKKAVEKSGPWLRKKYGY